MVLNFKEYSFDATKTAITDIRPTTSIVLPLPSNLQDTYTLNAGPGSLGIGGALVNAAIGGLGKNNMDYDQVSKMIYQKGLDFFNNATDFFGNANTADSNYAAYAKFISRSAVDMLPSGAGMAIDLATGTAINPHTSVNFDGVTLKTHSFSWTFAPKNAAESDKLLEIQNAMRRAILPRYEALGAMQTGLAPTDQALFKYPNLVDIFMLGIEQDYYYHFKPAIVKQMEFNFSGGGQSPAILKGGKPAIVTLNMIMDETAVHTSEDYGDV